MTEISNINLPDTLIMEAVRHAYFVAIRNRCTHTNVRILCVTGDEYILQKHMGVGAQINHDTTLGCCFFRGHHRGIFIKQNRDVHPTVKTLCHELAHAYTNPAVKHGYSWRSLYLLYYATLPRIFGINESDDDLYDEVVNTVYRYELRGRTLYERHLKAMKRMQQWYVDRVESAKNT